MGRLTDWLLGPDLTASGADIAGVATPDEWASREHFARITHAELFDKHLDEIHVDREAALAVAAVDKGHQIITGQMAVMPLVLVDQGGRKLPGQPPLVVQPEVGRSRFQTMWHTIDDLVFHGKAYWHVTERYADTNRPKRVKFAPVVKVGLTPTGRVETIDGVAVNAADVLRFDGPHDGILNRPKRIREAIAIDIAATNASANPVPSVDLHQKGGDPLPPEKVEEMKAGWRRARQSAGGGVGYSNANIDVRTLGQHPEQLLIAGRNATALNIARMLNLSAWAVDASVEGSSLTYANIQSRSRELIDYTLRPYMEAITSRLAMEDVFSANQFVRFDSNALLSADAKTTADTLAVLVNAGIITAEQAQRVLAGASLESVL